MTAVATFLVRAWAPLLALLATVTGVCGWRALHLELDLSFRTFFLAEPEDDLATAFKQRFRNNAGAYLFTVLQGDDVLRPDVLTAVAGMSEAIERVPGIERVYSLATVPFVRGAGDQMFFEPVSDVVAAGTAPDALRPQLTASPLYARRLLSTDGRSTVVVALLATGHTDLAARAQTTAAVHAAIDQRLPLGFRAEHTGYAVTEAEYAGLVLRGFSLAQVVATILMGLALYLSFRTIPAVVLPLATIGIATVITLGIMELTGQRLTFTNASVPLLMLVLGVTENSFLIARYHDELTTRGWYPQAAATAVADVLWPGLIAAATTVVGFFSLGAGHLGLTRDFGFNMGIGSIVAFVVTILLVPGALNRQRRLPPAARAIVEHGVVARLLERLSHLVIGRPWAVVAGALLVAAVGLVGLTRTRVDQYATRELPTHHPLMALQQVIDGTLSGTFPTAVGVHARHDGSLTTPERLAQIAALQAQLATQPDVVKTWSIVDYLREIHMAAHGGDPAFRRIPETAALVEQYLLLLAMGGRSADIDALLDPTGRWATIMLGTTDLGTGALRQVAAATQDWVRRTFGDALDVRFGGDYWEVSRGNDVMAWDQVVSTVTAFAMVLPIVGLFLRSWPLTLLCIPPNVVPLLAATALMGFAGLPLRTGTSIILPATIGVVIDTTTHFLARAREEWHQRGDYAAAVRAALLGTGRGMISSTTALVCGFLAYQIPDFQSFKDVGLLAGWTFSVALVANLLLTPVLVLLVRPFGTTPGNHADAAPKAVPRRAASRG